MKKVLDHFRYYMASLYTLIGILGFWLGGLWVWLGFLGVLLAIIVGDAILGEDTNIRQLRYPWLADGALYLQLPLMVVLYVAMAWRVHVGFGALSPGVTVLCWGGSAISAGFLGAVPTLPINHELMHRRTRFPRVVASLLGTFYGDPNRDIGHIYTHHIHVGTSKDSDTPYRGEIVYTFLFRASVGAYHDAFVLERARMQKRGRSVWNWRSRVPRAILMILIIWGGFDLVIGWPGVVLAMASMAIGKLTVEAFNYTQHYGLIRVEGQPFEPRHTWEHNTFFIRSAGVEITTHADHHRDPYIPFYELQPSSALKMPNIALCFLASLIPSVWFKKFVIPRLRYWDLHMATPEERELARAANERAGWPDWQTPSALSAGDSFSL